MTDPIVTTASAATIQTLKRAALTYATTEKRDHFAHRMSLIVHLRKRYDKKWHHQL